MLMQRVLTAAVLIPLLLAAIAEYFGVDRNYLLDLSSVTPERLQAEFAASRRARADQLLATVERTLPDASAELVEQMRALLDEFVDGTPATR